MAINSWYLFYINEHCWIVDTMYWNSAWHVTYQESLITHQLTWFRVIGVISLFIWFSPYEISCLPFLHSCIYNVIQIGLFYVVHKCVIGIKAIQCLSTYVSYFKKLIALCRLIFRIRKVQFLVQLFPCA